MSSRSSSAVVSGGQPVVVALDACLERSPVLVVDVDVRSGIVADEHGRQADVPELGDVRGHLGADTRREWRTFHEDCRHRGGTLVAWSR